VSTIRQEALERIRRLSALERRKLAGSATPAESAEFAALITSREAWALSPWFVAWMSGASYTAVRRMPLGSA
jgi:hypothetical protein